MSNDVHKKAEEKIKEWLDHPELGYSIDRIPDQMNGLYGSKNICDFMCFHTPNLYYIESKSTYEDRFDFSLISDYQYENLLKKSKIQNVWGLIIILYISHKRAFILDIRDIDKLSQSGKKSLNIQKLNKWDIPYVEIPTVPNNRKNLLDYEGDLVELVDTIDRLRTET
jgi:penicillin-binding protein-related factor A (putative recombinase)